MDGRVQEPKKKSDKGTNTKSNGDYQKSPAKETGNDREMFK
jgi:hypothetical protein